MQTHSLFELNEYIRRVLALNLPDALWIRCEIGQVNQSRGHVYLELIEKEHPEADIRAQAQAVIWQRTFRSLKRKLGKKLDALLQDGMAILIQARVEYHERYGLKLSIQDIDPAYTMGQLALRRQQIIQRLQKEQLLERNRQRPTPIVFQRIAVLSSEGAAGWQDFRQQLQENLYGYQFKLTFFPTAVQGLAVEAETCKQLRKIKRMAHAFDSVVLIRGGGSRLDLGGFDSYELGKAIAELPLPLLTGIGHDIDETVADLVAWKSLKTPTATADFIITHNLQFEQELLGVQQWLQQFVTNRFHQEDIQLNSLQQELERLPQQRIRKAQDQLLSMEKEIPLLSKYILRTAKRQLNELEKISDLLRPEASLKRGFTLTTKNGKIVRSAEELKPGDLIQTRFADGTTKSKIS